jgi:hypothetical protein
MARPSSDRSVDCHLAAWSASAKLASALVLFDGVWEALWAVESGSDSESGTVTASGWASVLLDGVLEAPWAAESESGSVSVTASGWALVLFDGVSEAP